MNALRVPKTLICHLQKIIGALILSYSKRDILTISILRNLYENENENVLGEFLTCRDRLYFSTVGNSSSNQVLNPYFVTGLIDAEGTFGIVLTIDYRSKTGWKVDSRFIIELHKKDKQHLTPEGRSNIMNIISILRGL
jgi:hypothetical protein